MGASSTNFRPRLTQDEKTAETRRRLLDAAIVCLIERGYSNTTTSEIAERAGLSRGAQLYHFPEKRRIADQRGRAPFRPHVRRDEREGRAG